MTNKHSVELLKTESVTDATGTHTVYHYIFDDPEHAGGPKVRKTPSWPRSWASFRLL